MDGQLLVIHQLMLTPKTLNDDKWFETNSFPHACTLRGKLCIVVINSREL